MKNQSSLRIPFILSLALLALFPARPARAAKERDVTVSGTCTREATPDRGAIVLTAEFLDEDIKTVTKRAAESYEHTREAVKRLDLENLELQTVEYSVGERREWEKDKSVFKGYRARMGLRVATSSIPRLGEVIAVAAREGLKDVGQLNTFLSEEKKRTEQFACLKEASENAKAKAEKLASSLGARLGEVLSISEHPGEGGFQPVPRMQMPNLKMARGGEAMAPPSIEAGQQEITVTIQAVFGLL